MTGFPQILALGDVASAHKDWSALQEICQVLILTSKTREELLEDLRTKYKDIIGLYLNVSPRRNVIGVLDKDIVSHLPRSLKFVSQIGAGYDRIDVEALTQKGIQVSNTPEVVDDATADTALYLLIGAMRNFNGLAHQLRQGNFRGNVPPGHDPEGKILGIIGLGGIGRALRDKAENLKFSKVLYFNRHRLSPDLEGNAELVSFDDLLDQSDVIFVSVPLNKSTHHLINAEALSKTKKGVIIVNTSRGPVIDEQALVDSIKSGQVRSVGLDVFEHEPNIHPDLLSNPNVLLLPHAGAYTSETFLALEKRSIANIKAALTTGKVIDLVPEQRGKL